MSLAVIVSDTSPLNYLVLIQAADLLPRLFSKVIIPPAVRDELTRNQTPEAVRNWMTRPPAWLEVVVPRSVPPKMDLDEGESEAISLALELGIALDPDR